MRLAVFFLALLLAPPLHAATFTVDSTGDTVDAVPGDGIYADAAGACTLRAAIQETNALVGADEIELPDGTYQLAIPGTGEDAGATGDLDVTDDLVLIGESAESTAIDANGIDSVLDVATGISLEVMATAFTGGDPLRQGRSDQSPTARRLPEAVPG
jgi:CSLREA domain-containing protein